MTYNIAFQKGRQPGGGGGVEAKRNDKRKAESKFSFHVQESLKYVALISPDT